MAVRDSGTAIFFTFGLIIAVWDRRYCLKLKHEVSYHPFTKFYDCDQLGCTIFPVPSFFLRAECQAVPGFGYARQQSKG